MWQSWIRATRLQGRTLVTIRFATIHCEQKLADRLLGTDAELEDFWAKSAAHDWYQSHPAGTLVTQTLH